VLSLKVLVVVLLSLVFFLFVVVVLKCDDLIQRKKKVMHVFLVFFSLLHFLLKDTHRQQQKKRERAETRQHGCAQNYDSERTAAIAVSLLSSKSTFTVCAERERDIRESKKERAKNLFY
tara:strand:+ start:232 stop:588 length:357 start_codon:yes stop_codon:yes gene_type:complete